MSSAVQWLAECRGIMSRNWPHIVTLSHRWYRQFRLKVDATLGMRIKWDAIEAGRYHEWQHVEWALIVSVSLLMLLILWITLRCIWSCLCCRCCCCCCCRRNNKKKTTPTSAESSSSTTTTAPSSTSPAAESVHTRKPSTKTPKQSAVKVENQLDDEPSPTTTTGSTPQKRKSGQHPTSPPAADVHDDDHTTESATDMVAATAAADVASSDNHTNIPSAPPPPSPSELKSPQYGKGGAPSRLLSSSQFEEELKAKKRLGLKSSAAAAASPAAPTGSKFSQQKQRLEKTKGNATIMREAIAARGLRSQVAQDIIEEHEWDD